MSAPHVQNSDNYSPPPKNGQTRWIELFSWHLWLATTKEGWWRYLTLICVVAVSVGFLIFAVGAAVAIMFAGLHVWMAYGIGAGGVIAFIAAVAHKIRR
jgi:hypothetical protein